MYELDQRIAAALDRKLDAFTVLMDRSIYAAVAKSQDELRREFKSLVRKSKLRRWDRRAMTKFLEETAPGGASKERIPA
jgi:hypothetical protein